MATRYTGNVVASTWSQYHTIEVTETPTTVKIEFADTGIKMSSTTYDASSESNYDNTTTFTINGYADGCIKNAYGLDVVDNIKATNTIHYRGVQGSYYTEEGGWLSELGSGYAIIYKSNSAKSVTVVSERKVVKWTRHNNSTGTNTTYNNSTSTVTTTINIPALAKPSQPIVNAIRNEETQSTVTISAKIGSYEGDAISKVVFYADNDIIATLTDCGTIGSTGNLTVSATVENVSEQSVSIKAVATGNGGDSSIGTYQLPVSFYTMEFGAEGKLITMGQSAYGIDEEDIPENGLFACSMDAVFSGNVTLPKECHQIKTRNNASDEYTLYPINAYMNANQTVYLEENILDQRNGIILAWSIWDSSDPTDAWAWHFQVVPKAHIALGYTSGHSVVLAKSCFAQIATKYVYIQNNYIAGNAQNVSTGTSASGIKYTNNAYVLRYVFGF